MICFSKTATSFKIALGAISAFVIIGGIWYAAVNYFPSSAVQDSPAGQNPAGQPAVDPAKLNAGYQAKSAKIIADFLSAAENNDSAIGALAKQAQAGLLALSLPAQFKQKHLAEVLLLGEISDLASGGQTAKLSAKITELKNLFSTP